MKSKIEAMIILVSFSATAAIYPATIIAAASYTIKPNSNAAIVYLLLTWPIFFIALLAFFAAVAAWLSEKLSEKDGDWITVSSDGATKKRAVKVWNMGKRDYKAEKHINQ